MKARLFNSLAHGKTVLVSLLLAVSLTLTSNPLTAQAATLVVDDNPLNNGGVPCPVTAFTTIQSAVAVAPAGSTITVCPGTYAEQVQINSQVGLKLVAKGAVTVIPPPPYPATGAVFLVTNSTNITIKNFRVSGAGLYGAAGNPIGILYANSSGKITNNVVTGMTRTPPDTTPFGVGILVGSLTPTPLPVKIMQNTVQGYQYSGISAVFNVLVNVTQNRVVSSGGAGSSPVGIWLAAVKGGKVVNNTVSHDWAAMNFKTSTGIQVQDSSGVKVLQNKVSESSNGIELHATCGAAPTMNNVVKANRLRDGYNTIWLFADATGGPCTSSVTNNVVANNVLLDYNPPTGQYGIWLLPAGPVAQQVIAGNSILNNKVYGFFNTGIILGDPSLSLTNTIAGNKLNLQPIGGLDVTPSTAQHDNTIPYQPLPEVPWP